MGKETKEKGKHRGKKITQFPTQSDVQEELEDAAMDRFLRQSIIEDADRIERELNEDPKLIGIGASDDLFGKIVEELKTKGIWEGEKGTNVDEKSEPVKEEQQKPAIYDMLSQADREALAFGYQMQKKEQERKEKRKKRNRRLKHVSAAVVALVFVGGIGLSTEASRRWIFQVGDIFLEKLGASVKNNFIEEEKDIRDINDAEKYAMESINRETEIQPVKFLYLPDGMQFISFETNKEASFAVMEYIYEGNPFSIQMWGNNEKNVFYNQIDGKVVKKETVTTIQNIKIQIYMSVNNDEELYKAQFSYNDNFYYCKGLLEYVEIEKILKNIIIL